MQGYLHPLTSTEFSYKKKSDLGDCSPGEAKQGKSVCSGLKSEQEVRAQDSRCRPAVENLARKRRRRRDGAAGPMSDLVGRIPEWEQLTGVVGSLRRWERCHPDAQ